MSQGQLAAAAGEYVRQMVGKEMRRWGDQRCAMERIERRYGLPYWSLDHLRTGRAKTVEAGLFSRIRSAYIDLCERQIEQLRQEIAIERTLRGDDSIDDLETEAAALAARLEAKRKAR